MAEISVTALAPRIASTRLVTTVPMVSSASRTRTLVTIGKASATDLTIRASPAGSGWVSVRVAIWVCGAPLKALGENTSTKLMPRPCQSTVRILPMVAGMSRPSTLTTISSPILSSSPSAIFFSIETSGGPS